MLRPREWSFACTFRDGVACAGRALTRPLNVLNWRRGADAAKRQPLMLRLADRLGRETGRLRFLDDIAPPPPAPRRPDLARFVGAQLAAAWLGHATLLLRIAGRTVLTDPVFSTRVGLGLVFGTLGPKRFQQPALTVDQLPAINLILSSHAHFDHLDRPSLWRLAKIHRDVAVIAAPGTSDLLNDLGFQNVRELQWTMSTTAAGLRVTAVPVKHWGPRVFFDDWRGYNAYLIEAEQHRVLFGGDTAYIEAFAGTGPLDLMAVGISAYDPFVASHATPEQAWRMAEMAGARHVLPMHHSTFRLSREPMDEPLIRFLNAAGADVARVVTRNVGDLWVHPRAPAYHAQLNVRSITSTSPSAARSLSVFT